MLDYIKDKTVLFLEDNLDFAKNTTALLSIFVKNVLHVTTIKDAKAMFATHRIDIFITDIKLKNENGIDFISELRASNKTCPIIIISGHKDEEFLFRSIPLNLTAYLLKPIKYEDLIDALKRCSEKLKADLKDEKELKDGWVYDSELKVILRRGEKFSLNKKESLFMEMLSINRDRLITKDMLQINVWQEDEMSDSAVTNFILRIRRRFGKNFIYTIPDLGYRFKI
jgi:DNA-binding response OmpR family regulator